MPQAGATAACVYFMVLKQLAGAASEAYKKVITGLVWRFHFPIGLLWMII